MSAKELFSDAMWRDVAKDLRFVGARWWDLNRQNLVGLTRDEVQDIAHLLKAGNRRKAKEALIRRMSDEEWRAYVDGTTEQLEALAARRHAAIKALEQIGRWAAKVIGTAILGVL